MSQALTSQSHIARISSYRPKGDLPSQMVDGVVSCGQRKTGQANTHDYIPFKASLIIRGDISSSKFKLLPVAFLI